MGGPYALRAFAVRKADTVDEIQRKNLMILLEVHRLVKFGDGGNQSSTNARLEVLRPVLLHPLEQIDEPLTGHIVADQYEPNKDVL